MTRHTTSASNIHRRKLCPGSERMEEGLPDEESDQSREGTLLHGYDANPELDVAALKPYHRDLLRISAGLDEQIFDRAFENFGIERNDEFQSGRERELWAKNADGELVVPGHCDLWRFWPRTRVLAIVDKKFGYKVVTPAVANLQLRIYAIAGADEWKAEQVLVAVTQPRLPFDERLTMAAYTQSDIDKARDELLWILTASRQPNAPLVAGDEQCRYCKAKMLCPAYKEKFLSIEVAARDLAECDDDQLDQVLVAIAFADYIKEQARDEARKRVAAGRMPNYKLGAESEIRDVADVRKAMALLALRGDITNDDIKSSLDMSIGTIEERVRERKKCTWKVAKEIVAETLEMVISKKPKKRSLSRIK